MRDPKNIMEIAGLSPDFMGFIFYKKSKRFVGEEFSVPRGFPDNIKKVGVFVNESVEIVLKQVSMHRLDFVQLHGDESAELCGELKKKTKVIKVFRIDESFDFNSIREFNSYADFFLFDTKGDNFGGTGKKFNWDLLKQYDQQIPFFLSGGLSTENAHEAEKLKSMNLHAIDVNSGVESSPAVKDLKKIKQVQEILTSNFFSK